MSRLVGRLDVDHEHVGAVAQGGEGAVTLALVVGVVPTGGGGEIDDLNAELSPLRSFVLPGGHPAAAYLHLTRTVCRRAERLVVALAAHEGEHVSDGAIAYINRLSDFFFVASRWANAKSGAGDVLWVPGKTRQA